MNILTYQTAGQLRKHAASETAFTFTTQPQANGNLRITMSAIDTAAIPAGRYVYDIEIFDGTSVFRAFQGLVTVDPQVTTIAWTPTSSSSSSD